MRGIGKGQCIKLYIIPEVLKLIQKELSLVQWKADDLNVNVVVNETIK